MIPYINTHTQEESSRCTPAHMLTYHETHFILTLHEQNKGPETLHLCRWFGFGYSTCSTVRLFIVLIQTDQRRTCKATRPGNLVFAALPVTTWRTVWPSTLKKTTFLPVQPPPFLSCTTFSSSHKRVVEKTSTCQMFLPCDNCDPWGKSDKGTCIRASV